jgi:multidrug efflux system membrane fusion protein
MSTPEITQPLPGGAPRRRQSLLGTWWFWLLVMCALAAGIYFFLPKPDAQQRVSKKGGAGGSRNVPVVIATVKTSDIDLYLNGLGAVVPLNTVTVKSRVDGQLMRVLFREGQVVRKGDLLAEIDPRPFEVQVTQAEGQMARDQALLKNAHIDLERYRTLFGQDSIAKQQLDTQEALVRQYEGVVKSDQGAVDNAKLQLAYSRVAAPVGGRLGLRQVDAGNIVHSSDASGLVVITQLQPITVVFTIPEDNLPEVMKRLRSGDKLAVDAFDRGQTTKLASGELLTVDNQIDPTTGTVKLKAQFANDDNRLFPQQFVNIRMLLDVRRDAIVIPAAAVQRGTRGTFVYVVAADNTVSMRAVKLGPTQGENVAAETGLQPGESVVVDGADKLREGATVELANPNPTPRKDGVRKGGGRKGGDGARKGAGDGERKGAGDGETKGAGDAERKGAGDVERKGGRKGGDSTAPAAAPK